MMMFRFYLIGKKFTAWSDHKPLIPMYNDMTKITPARVNKHHNKVVDLTFDKYIKGKRNPMDYNLRHPTQIEKLMT